MRVAVKYFETYEKVFYVEANTETEALQIVEKNVEDDPEIIEDVEMENSGYRICTTNFHRKMAEDEWKRKLDFVEEEVSDDTNKE